MVATVLSAGVTGTRPPFWRGWQLERVLAFAFVAFVALIAIAPELVATHKPTATDFAAMLKPPSAAHWFGTDALGRDVFSRTIYGARYSVTIGLGAMLLALAVAVPAGVLSGVGGRWLDETIVRLMDIIGAFPELLLAILVIAILGPGVGNLVVAMGIAAIPKLVRVVRAQTRSVLVSGYVEHARTLGQSYSRTVFRHVLPNAVGALPVLATIGLGHAIIGAAALSFLGLGPRPPIPEWGLMLSEAIGTLRLAWWAGVFPGAMITVLVISLTVIGNFFQSIHERRHAA